MVGSGEGYVTGVYVCEKVGCGYTQIVLGLIYVHCMHVSVNTGKREVLGADMMFPILVLVVIHATIPFIHLVLVTYRGGGCVCMCMCVCVYCVCVCVCVYCVYVCMYIYICVRLYVRLYYMCFSVVL